jgi:hypothetical protein
MVTHPSFSSSLCVWIAFWGMIRVSVGQYSSSLGYFLGLNLSARRVGRSSRLFTNFKTLRQCKDKSPAACTGRGTVSWTFRNISSPYSRLIHLPSLLLSDHCTGPDPNAPKPLLAGIARIYRGLGVSAVRSITTHGLLWTFFDLVANYIDRLPRQ